MDFVNIAVLALTFLAPVAGVVYFTLGGGRARGMEQKACFALFGLAAVAAAVGVARIDLPVKMESLWALTLEQSGYFEFAFSLHWTRFVWIFFSAAIFLGFTAFDGPLAFAQGRKGLRLFFFSGSFLCMVLAFLSENIVLSVMFVEMAVFLLHAFGMEAGGPAGEQEKASFFKRACFLLLGLLVLFGLATSREFSTGPLVLLAMVLYLLSTLASRHNLSAWSEHSPLLLYAGMSFFLLGRVAGAESSAELYVPLAAVFGVACLVTATISLLSTGILGSTTWLSLSIFGYLLYLRFSSSAPADQFWGTFEAVGLGAACALGVLFRFGEKTDLAWKKAAALASCTLFLCILSGALPGVEAAATRFDSEISVAKVAFLGFLTFLTAAAAAKSLLLSFAKPARGADSPREFLQALIPALFVFAAQGGAMLRWSELNFESAIAAFPGMLYDPRVLVTSAAVAAGVLAGALVGVNQRKERKEKTAKGREPRLEDYFPPVDLPAVRRYLAEVSLPERGMDYLGELTKRWGVKLAMGVESLDGRLFGEKLFRAFSEYALALSSAARFFHSGQARAYVFLGLFVTLLSSLFFLWEGR